ncbi:bcl2-associated agonist of cell death [Denticeps clupeoides]|uniref:Uncharacterized protein n=1 Tax=Denticeps clupeoides TaxID=299321 RepID=A0AAY4A5X2_9TELE|nr:bcl2-associated agonist of cell death-like [Denticeps clupeoides]
MNDISSQLSTDAKPWQEPDLVLHQDGAPPAKTHPGGGRVRLYSESQVYTISRWEDSEPSDGGPAAEEGTGGGFRVRSQSAPAALLAAKRYGSQLRRMSDEFDDWLDRGDQKRASSPGQLVLQASRRWLSFLWGPREEEGRE